MKSWLLPSICHSWRLLSCSNIYNIITILNSCVLSEYVLNSNLFLYFQHHCSSLQCHMIFRNHNNMLIKKHLWLLAMLKIVVLMSILVKTKIKKSWILRWMESWKKQICFLLLNFCIDINVFTVTFDQFNVPLLNKSVKVFLNDLNLLNGSVC